MKIYRVLGRDGTATIPYALRQVLGFQPGDVVSFELTGSGILVRWEQVTEPPEKNDTAKTLEEFLESLPAKDQYDALVHLSVLWAQRQEGKIHG